MGFLDHQGESEFPFAKETVFNAMLKAIPTVKGMKVDNADKLQGRIVVKAGVSLMSWGENIPILLSEVAENRTQVKITSSPKTGVMFGGAFDLGKNRKNIEQILSATSRILSSSTSQSNQNTANSETANSNQQTQNFQQNTNMENQQIDKKWYDNKFITHLLLVVFFPVGLYALWKSRTIAKWWKITATVIIGLIVIAKLGDSDSSNSSSSSSVAKEKEEPKVELTQAQKDSIAQVEKLAKYEERKSQTIQAKDLYNAYQANEVSADNDFKDKNFYVEGVVGDIGKDILDDIYVTLKTGDYIGSVQCYIDDANVAANLQKGQRITVYGECNGLMMNVLMKDCKVVENLNDLR